MSLSCVLWVVIGYFFYTYKRNINYKPSPPSKSIQKEIAAPNNKEITMDNSSMTEARLQKKSESFSFTLDKIFYDYENKAETKEESFINEITDLTRTDFLYYDINNFSKDQKLDLWIEDIQRKQSDLEQSINLNDSIEMESCNEFLDALNSFISTIFSFKNKNDDYKINGWVIKINNLTEYLNLVEREKDYKICRFNLKKL